jgi:hypothetical protein
VAHVHVFVAVRPGQQGNSKGLIRGKTYKRAACKQPKKKCSCGFPLILRTINWNILVFDRKFPVESIPLSNIETLIVMFFEFDWNIMVKARLPTIFKSSSGENNLYPS